MLQVLCLLCYKPSCLEKRNRINILPLLQDALSFPDWHFIFGEESICLQLHIMSSLPTHRQNYIHCLCFPLCNKSGIKCFLWLVCIFSHFLVISIVSPFFSDENRFNYFLCVAGVPYWDELSCCSVPAVQLMSNNSAGSNGRTSLFNTSIRELVWLT